MLKYIIAIIVLLGVVLPLTVNAQMPSERVTIFTAPQPNSPILTNIGSAGSNGAYYGIVCHYSNGGISVPSNMSFTSKAPSSPNNSNNIQLSGWTCPSVDILKGSPNTAIAIGITTPTYNDIGTTPFPYSPTAGLPNIQLNGPFTFIGLTSYPPATITNSGIFTLDTSLSGYLIANITGNSTITLGNVTNGESFTVDVVEQPPGNYSITFTPPTGYSLIWSANNLPTFSTTSGSHNVVPFHILGNTIIGGLLGNLGGAVSGCGGNININCTQVLATSLSSPLPISQGGTATATPGETAGAGISISGTWPNQVFSLQTPISVGNGGTGTNSTLTGVVRGGSPLTASELSGDVTTSGSNATTVVSTHLSAALPVPQGGTGHTSASAGAANAIGALAINSNLSDLGSVATARTNLGLGALATATSPLSVSNGGTGASAAGATAANNIGALAIASNLSDLNNAATARTNLGLGTAATASTGTSGATVPLNNGNNTFSGTNTFSGSNTFSVAPTMSGANISAGTISSSSLANTSVTAGFYSNSNITVNAQGQITSASNGSGGGSGSGTINPVTILGLEVYYSALNAVSGLTNTVHAFPYASHVEQAIEACPQATYANSTNYALHNMIADSNGNTEMIEACSGSCTTATSSHPTWSASVGGQVTDNSGPNQIIWENVALGTYAPSAACTVKLDAGTTYTLDQTAFVGSDTVPVVLEIDGGYINATVTGGAGNADLVEFDKGIISGSHGFSSNTGSVIGEAGGESIDAIVESGSAYLSRLVSNPFKYQQTNWHLSGVYINPNNSTNGILKAAVWQSAIDGQGYSANDYVSPGPTGSTGWLVDDGSYAGMHWNNLNYINIWIGLGGDAYGLKTISAENSGGTFNWIGGAIVDGNANTIDHMLFDGHAAAIHGVTITGAYIETATGESSTTTNGIVINGVDGFYGTDLEFNGGPEIANCVETLTSESQTHVTGTETVGICINSINDQVYAYSNALTRFDYWTGSALSTGPVLNMAGTVVALDNAISLAPGTAGNGVFDTGATWSSLPFSGDICEESLATFTLCQIQGIPILGTLSSTIAGQVLTTDGAGHLVPSTTYIPIDFYIYSPQASVPLAMQIPALNFNANFAASTGIPSASNSCTSAPSSSRDFTVNCIVSGSLTHIGDLTVSTSCATSGDSSVTLTTVGGTTKSCSAGRFEIDSPNPVDGSGLSFSFPGHS